MVSLCIKVKENLLIDQIPITKLVSIPFRYDFYNNLQIVSNYL